jgi:diacylglycerol kinase family enzyme
MGTPCALGVIPIGSGNGFARHFGIPLKTADAARALAQGRIERIDVGTVNDHPFFVSCSMAWDAALVRSFERSPVRGFLPYLFAGVYEFFGYRPQPVAIELDGGETLRIPDPLILTVANLTQYGGGTVISPTARPDDGLLELVAVRRQDLPTLLANIRKLVGGSISGLPKVLHHQFRRMTVEREHAAQIQADGELVDAPARVEVAVKPRALNVLVPGPVSGPANAH